MVCVSCETDSALPDGKHEQNPGMMVFILNANMDKAAW